MSLPIYNILNLTSYHQIALQVSTSHTSHDTRHTRATFTDESKEEEVDMSPNFNEANLYL